MRHDGPRRIAERDLRERPCIPTLQSRTLSEARQESRRVAEVLGTAAYRALYENSPDGVLFTVPDGSVLAANPAACQILGRTEAEILLARSAGVGRPAPMSAGRSSWPSARAPAMPAASRECSAPTARQSRSR